MDEIFVTGMGAVVSSVIVFCGSVWLLLTLVMGARLAYFVTASVTLGFLLMMGIVWSTSQLGPVGKLPTFNPVSIAEGGDVDFGAADSYPDEGDWFVPPEEDTDAQAQISELESSALDFLGTAIQEQEIETFTSPDQAQVVAESGRLIQQGDQTYGAVLLGPVPGEGEEAPEPGDTEIDPSAPDTVMAVMIYDPGNPYGLARWITLGTFLLFVVHLFGLSRAEKKARQLAERTA
jgi:hypothetical protein